jgi:excisionase family DNA binding protein
MRTNSLPLAILLLTVGIVAKRLALSVRSVRTLIALGHLPIVRVSSRAIRVSEADLTAFIAARRQEARGPPKRKRPRESDPGGGSESTTRPDVVNEDNRSASEESQP